jgi:hypothetical protein
MRWRWFKKSGPLKAWTELQFKLSEEAEEMFKRQQISALWEKVIDRNFGLIDGSVVGALPKSHLT